MADRTWTTNVFLIRKQPRPKGLGFPLQQDEPGLRDTVRFI